MSYHGFLPPQCFIFLKLILLSLFDYVSAAKLWSQKDNCYQTSREKYKCPKTFGAINKFSFLHIHTQGNTHLQTHTSSWHMHSQQQTAGPCLQSGQSVEPQHVESKRFEAYVKSLWIQNKGLSGTLCLGWTACSLLCFPPHAASNTVLQVEEEPYHQLCCPGGLCSLLLHTPAHCCTHLSGRRRFACEGATTPRRPSPVTLPTVGEAAWSWMEEEDKENKYE